MDTPNSQKKSPRSSRKSEQSTTALRERPRQHDEDLGDETYIDRTFDHVARVRAAREAAQRRMEAFGDPSEYEVTIICGQLRIESPAPSQPVLDFPDEEKGARR